MSDFHAPDMSTEPRGLPLGQFHRHAAPAGVNVPVDSGADFRAKVMWTSVLALVFVMLFAVAGVVAINAAWVSVSLASTIVGAGAVLLSVAVVGRVYFLSRSLRPVSASWSIPNPGEHWDAGAAKVETFSSLPPPAAPWTQFAQDSAAVGQGPTLRREVFGKLAYRLQSLVNRLIHKIDQVEQEIEDPELLKSLYAIDHLATRIRRQIENLAVLGGEAPQRRSNVPVDVNAVLRASVSEIEHYKLVTTVPIHGAKIHGHVVAEIIHLLAELLENATTFTAADAPKVMLRAHQVTAGLAIHVQDRGIGISHDDIARLNRLLNGTTHVDVAQLLHDGRIGLAVVEILARRHNIGAELQPNIFGGTDASIVIPHALLSERDRMPDPSPRPVLPPPVAQDGSGAEVSPPTPGPRPAPRPAAPAAPVAPATPAAAAQHQAPVLPVRRRGQLYSQLMSGMPAEDAAADAEPGVDSVAHRLYGNPVTTGQSDRPALPQRRGSHLREELREPPAVARPIPGHNPMLMSSFQEGRELGRAELASDESPGRGSQQPRRAHDTEGD